MSTQICLCFMLISILYLNLANSVPAISKDMEEQDQTRSSDVLFERFGVDPGYLFGNRPYHDDDADKDAILHMKRGLFQKKWARFFQGSQTPYTIAFPALMRTRRWIQEEQ